MPKTIDLLLGIATVMLVLSLVVTALTHYAASLCNLRGRHLRAGLAILLARLDPRIGANAMRLATAILKDPLISETGGRMASFIHRAQLTCLCLNIAAEASLSGLPESDPQSYATPAQALSWTLRGHGIADPLATLDRIAHHALEFEQTHPELSELARLEMAVVSATAAPFVARINTCFDQTIDGVSARFTSAVRAITVAAALSLAAFLQIDCLALMNHLAIDNVPGSASVHADLVRIPPSWREWRREWTESGPTHTGGILLTAMLLSLGAPFWFTLLSGTLRLRPALPAQDDSHRRMRRTEKSAPVSTFATSSPASSVRLPESGEWHSVRVTRYSAGRR